MSDYLEVSQEEVERYVPGVIMQMRATGVADSFNSFAEAMEELDLWDFVYNQARVLAFAYADNRRLSNIVHIRSE